jgi:hypothetical protein
MKFPEAALGAVQGLKTGSSPSMPDPVENGISCPFFPLFQRRKKWFNEIPLKGKKLTASWGSRVVETTPGFVPGRA